MLGSCGLAQAPFFFGSWIYWWCSKYINLIVFVVFVFVFVFLCDFYVCLCLIRYQAATNIRACKALKFTLIHIHNII